MRRILEILLLTFLLFVVSFGLLHVFSSPSYASIGEKTICPGHIGDCPLVLKKCASREDCECWFFDMCVEDE